MIFFMIVLVCLEVYVKALMPNSTCILCKECQSTPKLGTICSGLEGRLECLSRERGKEVERGLV